MHAKSAWDPKSASLTTLAPVHCRSCATTEDESLSEGREGGGEGAAGSGGGGEEAVGEVEDSEVTERALYHYTASFTRGYTEYSIFSILTV